MKSPSPQRYVDQASKNEPHVLIANLARNIIVHGPKPGHQITFLARTRLYSHTGQSVADAFIDVLQGSFATSGLRFGVAMLIGIDPMAPPDDVEHQINAWLETSVVFSTVALSEIGEGQEGLLAGMLSAWVSEYGPVQA